MGREGWATHANNSLPESLSSQFFTASKKFITGWKKNKIVSRKITKFVTPRILQEQPDVKEKALDFVLEVQEFLQDTKIDLEKVINIDQMGINLEVATGRTLEIQGANKVERIVQAENAVKHSLTIMPAVTASGKIISPLYVMLKEPHKDAYTGIFGSQVEKKMFKHENIFVKAHSSAVMNKTRTKEYFQDLLFVHAPNDFLQFKHFLKKCQNRIRLENLEECSIAKRDNLLKLISLAMHQFQAPVFKPMIQYAFFKCGYVLERPPRFQTPSDLCFPTTQFENC
uniref:DDE-1 domain-containing protein n=1 Tax=Phlebotomus papatasi TaxID=29031 RepID=A0A1B0CYV5_PHLPP